MPEIHIRTDQIHVVVFSALQDASVRIGYTVRPAHRAVDLGAGTCHVRLAQLALAQTDEKEQSGSEDNHGCKGILLVSLSRLTEF